MAKKKAKAAGKPKAAAAKRAPAPKATPVNQVREIQKKYQGAIPKRPQQALESVRKELRHAKQPLYALNKKIKEAPTPYYARKYRKQRRELEAQLAPQISKLAEQREDFKSLIKNQETIRHEKTTAQRQLKTLRKKLNKADEEQDYKELERLTYQILKLEGNIDALRGALGVEIKKTETEEYEPSEEEDRKGYLEDPNNPYTIWEAIHKLESDLEGGQWKYFIIDGRRFSVENIISITMAASAFWLSLKQAKTDTPRVNRYFNLKTKSVKYVGFKS